MKILVVHQYYVIPGMPGGSRFNEFARLWSDAGHDVTVICGTLEYSTGQTPEKYKGRWITREKDDAVDVWRCHVPSSYNASYAGRMWAFSGWTLSAITAALRVKRPDVVIATSPPLVAVAPGWVAAHAHGDVPWIFEMRDLWPESAITTGVLKKDGFLTKVLFALERWGCKSADAINVLTPAFRDDLVRRGLATPEKIAFVPNGADAQLFKPGPRDNEARRELGWGDKFVAMYAGAHGRANALGQLVDAAEHLKNEKDILIASVGDGPERQKHEDEAKRRGLTNIVFHGGQPKKKMPAIVSASDVGMAVLQKNDTFKTVYPNKVFDYMAAERPTLLAIDGVARKLVCDDAQAGVFVEPENGAAIARTLIAMKEDAAGRAAMGKRGRAWVLANQTRESLAERYLAVMKDVVEAHKRGPAAKPRAVTSSRSSTPGNGLPVGGS
jgi:glycosyltransferase involved in cell wall biosynthesis